MRHNESVCKKARSPHALHKRVPHAFQICGTEQGCWRENPFSIRQARAEKGFSAKPTFSPRTLRILPVLVLLIANPACNAPARSDAKKSNGSPGAHALLNVVSASSDPNDTSPVDRVTVNSETVMAADLLKGLHEELSTKAKTLSPEAYKSYVEQRAAQLIGDKVAEMLLFQRASLRLSEEIKSNIDKHVDREIRKIVTSEHDGIQRRYEKFLESHGQTLAEVREKLRREIIIATFLEQEVKPKVAEPTRTELLEAFKLAADSLRRPPRRSMSLIDVRISARLPKDAADPTPEQSKAAREEAMSRIRSARDELRAGAEFADVARRYSDGLNAAEGGSWGWVAKGSVRERFEPAVEALYKLGPGEISPIVETPDGFFVVRCDELDPGREPDFQSVQLELKDRHFRAAYNRRIVELAADMRGKARVESANLERFHAAIVNAGLALEAQSVTNRVGVH